MMCNQNKKKSSDWNCRSGARLICLKTAKSAHHKIAGMKFQTLRFRYRNNTATATHAMCVIVSCASAYIFIFIAFTFTVCGSEWSQPNWFTYFDLAAFFKKLDSVNTSEINCCLLSAFIASSNCSVHLINWRFYSFSFFLSFFHWNNN